MKDEDRSGTVSKTQTGPCGKKKHLSLKKKQERKAQSGRTQKVHLATQNKKKSMMQ
jgi:hypothetical protein